jgi:hypothetical protein
MQTMSISDPVDQPVPSFLLVVREEVMPRFRDVLLLFGESRSARRS